MRSRFLWATWGLVLVLSLSVPVLSAPLAEGGTKTGRGNVNAPDVLILTQSMMSGADYVMMAYAKEKTQAEIDADLEKLTKETGWTIRNLKVSTEQPGDANSSPMTSAEFMVSSLIQPGSGVLPVDLIVSALRQYKRINLVCLVPPAFIYGGVRDFENRYVQISFDAQPGTYRFAVNVKDSSFGKLDLKPPSTDTVAVPETARKSMPWVYAVLAVLLSLSIAVLVFFVVDGIMKSSARNRH